MRPNEAGAMPDRTAALPRSVRIVHLHGAPALEKIERHRSDERTD
jgi:hypothetical protein